MERRRSRKFIAILLAIAYSYTHFFYLMIGRQYVLIFAIVVNRIRCVQLSFYFDMLGMRLDYINMELNKLQNSKIIDRNSKLRSDRIVTLKDLYSGVWKTALLLNECFSWSIVAITAFIFLELTINSYLLYINMSTSGSLSEIGLTIYCMGMMPTILAFLLSCRSADRCSEKVLEISYFHNIRLQIICIAVLGNSKYNSQLITRSASWIRS